MENLGKVIGAIGLAIAGGAACAQERVYWTPADVKMLMVGNKVTIQRTDDKAVVDWIIRPDGSLRGINRERKNTLAAEWSFKDDGSFCVRWRGIPEVNCYFYFRTDRRMVGVLSKSPDARPEHVIVSSVPLG